MEWKRMLWTFVLSLGISTIGNPEVHQPDPRQLERYVNFCRETQVGSLHVLYRIISMPTFSLPFNSTVYERMTISSSRYHYKILEDRNHDGTVDTMFINSLGTIIQRKSPDEFNFTVLNSELWPRPYTNHLLKISSQRRMLYN